MSNDRLYWALQALSKYLERGQAAACKLGEGNIPEAEELLRWQRAALQNFRVLDAQLTSSERSAIDRFYAEHKDEFAAMYADLETNLNGSLTECLDRLSGMRRERNKIRRYKQSEIQTGNFTQSV